jgi:hypothetical protein
MTNLERYLKVAPKNIREFILNECEFVFGDISGYVPIACYIGYVKGRHLIKFVAINPRISTFFHEVGHAYFKHKVTNNNFLHEQQEKEADEFAKNIIC